MMRLFSFIICSYFAQELATETKKKVKNEKLKKRVGF